jgi:hypothetical protein
MPWVRIDDHFPDHPKVVQAGPLGIALHVAALCYCSRHLTDGFVPAAVVPNLLPTAQNVTPEVTRDISVTLLEVGMWTEVRNGFQIHDYLDYNPSREKVLRERAAASRRQQKRRNDGNAVSHGDVTPPVTGVSRVPRTRTPYKEIEQRKSGEKGEFVATAERRVARRLAELDEEGAA